MKELKVLFVVKSMAIETLGPMYLSAVVRQAGHKAKICELSDAVSMAKLWRPDIIGYSVMTGDVEKFKKVDEEIKDWWLANGNRLTSIVGGSDPTFFPQGYDWADMVISGEAEDAIGELLKSDTVYSDIDSFPWPDRTDFPGHKIRDFITSRGCPYNCSYCYNERFAEMFSHLPRVRTRSVDDVIREIVDVNPEFVYLQDSCFGVDNKWLREFSRQYRNQLNIPYHCHMRPSQITEERVLLLHDSNCMSIRIALETSSNRLRKLINRGKTSNEETYKAARLLKKWSIKLMVQNMLGLPTSTIEEDLETLEVNIKCHPDYAWCSIFQPYPGTELADKCKAEGWYKGDFSEISDSFFDSSVLEFDEEHKERLEVLQKVFALCVEVQYMPEVEELRKDNLGKLVHKIMRRMGDRRLYGDAA